MKKSLKYEQIQRKVKNMSRKRGKIIKPLSNKLKMKTIIKHEYK